MKHKVKKWGMCRGFTLIELLIATAVIGILAAIAIPAYTGYIDRVRNGTVAADIRGCQVKILGFTAENNILPTSLNSVGCESQDAWGNPYRYFDLSNLPPGVQPRADKNLNPINSDYDLYSMGKDGETAKQLISSKGKDDIVRANDGLYIGLGENY